MLRILFPASSDFSAPVLRFVTLFWIATAIVAVGPIGVAAQTTSQMPPKGSVPGGCNYNQDGDYLCWGSQFAGPADKFASIAFSSTTLRSGSSTGQASQDAADAVAMSNCRKTGAADCKVQIWGKNVCMTVATSAPDRKWFVDHDVDRRTAGKDAFQGCRDLGGARCTVEDVECADDKATVQPPPPFEQKKSRAGDDPIVGCYQWFNGAPVAIRLGNKVVAGPFTATWKPLNKAQRSYTITWPQPSITNVTIAADQKSLTGANQYGVKAEGTRLDGSTGLAGTWGWVAVTPSLVTVASNGSSAAAGTFTGMSMDATLSWSGKWQAVAGSPRSYTLTDSELPVDTVTLSPDGSHIRGTDQYGIQIIGVRTETCATN